VAIPDRELEHSRLSGLFTREGVTVEVQIYRFAGTADAWSLEIVDQEGLTGRSSTPSRRMA
jgi:hypothetical protein